MDPRIINTLMEELNKEIPENQKKQMRKEIDDGNLVLIEKSKESEICKNALQQMATAIEQETTLNVRAFGDHLIRFKLKSSSLDVIECQKTFQHCILPALGIPRHLCEYIHLESIQESPPVYSLQLEARQIGGKPRIMSIWERIGDDEKFYFAQHKYEFNSETPSWCVALRRNKI